MESDLQKGKATPRRKKTAESPSPGESAANESEKPNGKRFEIDIFRDWCKCCGICAAFCPRQCISLDANGEPTIVNSDRCNGCGWCEMHCPDFAISVRQKGNEH